MANLWRTLVVAALVTMAAGAVAQDAVAQDSVAQDKASAQEQPAGGELKEKIAALVKQLDDEVFEVRERAEKALVELGDAAFDAATEATRSASAEVKQRAARIVRALREAGAELRHVGLVQRDDLRGCCTITSSSDGKFLYAAAYPTNTIVAFRRDPATGSLEHLQSLTDAENLKGVTCVRLAPSGKRALAVAFGSKKVTLLSRDPDKGTLEIAHAAGPELAPGVSMLWPIDGVFSPDEKHIYAVDDRSGAVVGFAIEGDRLAWVQFSLGREGSFEGARTIAMCPDGKTLVVGGTRAGTLCVLDRDAASGRVEVRQVLRDGEDNVNCLAGIHGLSTSGDGKFVYSTSGRFQGDQAVAAFRFGEDGKLALVREFICDQSDLVSFQGGNNVLVSGDGQSVFACGTVSRSLACFRRNAESGDLAFVTTIRDDAQTGAGPDLGPADVDVSADGRFVYLTLEQDGAISIFERRVKK
jgi:6-phosphogluconolactonase (cycloisomerase 2 family)